MPLKTGSGCRSKACKNKAISYNIHELTHNGSKSRSHKQIVAIALHMVNKTKKR